MMSWRAFLARAAVASVMACVAVFVGVRLATADPGVPGGPTTDSLTFAGVLRTAGGAPFVGTTTLTFIFRKSAAGGARTEVCRSTTDAVDVPPSGAFAARVPIGPIVGRSTCTPALFDGTEVSYDILQGSEDTPIARDVSVTPVPYARFADQAGVNNDCPAGYARDPMESPGTVCVRTFVLGGVPLRDEVVKVGTGGSAFWVDRYEASLHSRATGTQLGASDTVGGGADDIASVSGLSLSGQHPAGETPALAFSHAGQPTINITWFQANEACRGAGKRLPSGSEWLAAASGTQDNDTCRTNTTSTGARPGARTNTCRSTWGAHEMIGNVGEWTDEWYSSVGYVTMRFPDSVMGVHANSHISLGPDLGDDATWNVTSIVTDIHSDYRTGSAAAAVRGGGYASGTYAGVFTMTLDYAPLYKNSAVGFRCVVPR